MRILIVTPDIDGPIRNGGIGTAFSNLAYWAKSAGHEISISYALGHYSENGPIDRWITHYTQAGVPFYPVHERNEADDPEIDARVYRRRAWAVHQWLLRRERDWDMVIFPEWMGLAFYVALSKHQGLAYQNLAIVVNTHSPESWAMEGNFSLPHSIDDVERDFMERETIRLADWIISPSQYLLEWMRSRHWEMPELSRQRVIPNIESTFVSNPDKVAEINPTNNVIFFGRLEIRKGLKLFCDAIDRLPEQIRYSIRKIKFLGKPVSSNGFDSIAYINQRSADWGVDIAILIDRDRTRAVRELQNQGTLVVIPSLVENSPYTVLECLRNQVRFIASNVGGIPELVAETDHKDTLFTPTPGNLAETLQRHLQQNIGPARPSFTESFARQQWRDFFSSANLKSSSTTPKTNLTPLVSICLVHHKRPTYLLQAIESLRRQTYKNFEVILVDDGSDDPASISLLEELRKEFLALGWKLIQQKNSYLGAARNRAAASAKGDYIIFMDDDNIAFPNMVETFVRAALSSNADVLTSVMMLFSGDDYPDKTGPIWVTLGGCLGCGIFENLYGDAQSIWRKDSFDKISGFTVDYGLGHEDWELFSNALLSGLKLELVPEPLYWYRVNPHGMLRSGDAIANSSRSIRPFLKENPHGLGMALAYALSLNLPQSPATTKRRITFFSIFKSIPRLVRGGLNPTRRSQFIGVLRSRGFKEAMKRAIYKSS